MKLSILALAAIIALIPGSAFAETRSADIKAWLCKKVPHWSRCYVPLPSVKPVEIVPVPEPAPTVTPAPVWVWPDVPKLEQPAEARREPQAPAAPAAAPKIETPKPRALKTRQRREDDQEPQRRRQAPQAETGFCFFPISCSTVCEYARAGDNRRGTPCQNARGLACIRSTCPDVLKKK